MKTLAPVSLLLLSNRRPLNPAGPSAEHPCWVLRLTSFFRGLAACKENASRSSKDFINSSVSHISSLSTPNGPWAYTIVPWED
jgi:hypothetical protein